MKNTLVLFNQTHYRGEGVCQGFKLFTEEDWNQFWHNTEQLSPPFEFPTGTGFNLMFEDRSAVSRAFTVILLTPEEVRVITERLGEEFGFFPELQPIFDRSRQRREAHLHLSDDIFIRSSDPLDPFEEPMNYGEPYEGDYDEDDDYYGDEEEENLDGN